VFLIYYDLLNGPSSQLKPILKLVFSSAVLPEGFRSGAITLQATSGATNVSMTVEGESVENDALLPNILLITFTRNDVDRLKLMEGLARSKESTFLSLPGDSIIGASGIAAAPIAGGAAQPVRLYNLDPMSFIDAPVVTVGNENLAGRTTDSPSYEKPPLLVSTGLNMDKMQLVLSFLEPVDSTTLKLEALRLLATEIDDGLFYRFASSGEIATTSSTREGNDRNATQVTVQLTSRTMNQIKLVPGLATSQESSMISADAGLIQDYRGISSEAIPARQVENYISDATKPTLIAFDVNLETEVISLSFSETMNIDNVTLSGIRIQNNAYKATSVYALTGGYIRKRSQVLEGSYAIVEVHMTSKDLDALLSNQMLLESVSNTYISLKGKAFADRSGNAVQIIRQSNALQASAVVQAGDDSSTGKEESSRSYSATTKALIGSAISFVLLLIFIVVFIAPRWNTQQEYSPKLWEQSVQEQNNLAVPMAAAGNNELEWDAQCDKRRYASPQDHEAADPDDELTHATVAFTYEAVQDNELSIKRGEIVILQPEADGCPPGWCYATNLQHETGLVQLAMLHLPEATEKVVDLSLPNRSQMSDRFPRSPDVERQPTTLQGYHSGDGIQLGDRRTDADEFR